MPEASAKMEAMAQVATALTGNQRWAAIEKVAFVAPVRVPEGRTVTIRVAALQEENGTVRVTLRSSESDFNRDHFSAIFRPIMAKSGKLLTSKDR